MLSVVLYRLLRTDCGSVETTRENLMTKSGRIETVKANIDRFQPFPKPQVAGPIPAEGASVESLQWPAISVVS